MPVARLYRSAREQRRPEEKGRQFNQPATLQGMLLFGMEMLFHSRVESNDRECQRQPRYRRSAKNALFFMALRPGIR